MEEKDDDQPEAFKEAMRDAIIDEYTELLLTTPDDELIAATFFRLKKATMEFEYLNDSFMTQKYDTIETLMRLDVLLGGLGGIRAQIKAAIK